MREPRRSESGRRAAPGRTGRDARRARPVPARRAAPRRRGARPSACRRPPGRGRGTRAPVLRQAPRRAAALRRPARPGPRSSPRGSRGAARRWPTRRRRRPPELGSRRRRRQRRRCARPGRARPARGRPARADARWSCASSWMSAGIAVYDRAALRPTSGCASPGGRSRRTTRSGCGRPNSPSSTAVSHCSRRSRSAPDSLAP